MNELEISHKSIPHKTPEQSRGSYNFSGADLDNVFSGARDQQKMLTTRVAGLFNLSAHDPDNVFSGLKKNVDPIAYTITLQTWLSSSLKITRIELYLNGQLTFNKFELERLRSVIDESDEQYSSEKMNSVWWKPLGMSADEAQSQRPKARPRLRDFTDKAFPWPRITFRYQLFL
ncbi:hypothetical protein AgCh_032071 [Apium graveolens]